MCPVTRKVINTYRSATTATPTSGDMHLVIGKVSVLRVDGRYVTYTRGQAIIAINKLIHLLKGN